MPARSASGARIAGDHHQHLIGWTEAMLALRDEGVITVAVEAVEAGSCDDVVVSYEDQPDRYLQVKFGVDAREAVGNDFLTRERGRSGTSLLQRLHATWRQLTSEGDQVELELVTSHQLDPDNPLLKLRDSRTEKLMPALADRPDGSHAGEVAREWAKHLGIERDELQAMLEDLRLQAGWSSRAVETRVADVMLSLGFEVHDGVLSSAVACVGDWVADGRRCLTPTDIREEVERLRLPQKEPGTLLAVSAIDEHPSAAVADVAVDWTPHFPADVPPPERRAPLEPSGWTSMQADLPGIVTEVEALGRRHVVVNGAMRLPCWFVVGNAFPRVADWDVTCGRVTQQWSSADVADSSVHLEQREEEVGHGDDLALAIALTTDPTHDVRRHLTRDALPVRRLVTLQPAGGPHDQLVTSGAAAVSIAQQVQQQARALVGEGEHPRVHLFLAAPAGAALLIGHRWNRIAPTTTYEDLGALDGYVAAFEVGA